MQGLRDELEAIAAKFAAQGFWRDGWLAVKHTRFYCEKDKASENYARLTKLEETLRPRDLVQRVRGRVFVSDLSDVDDIDADDARSFEVAMEQQQIEARSLGGKVANDLAALTELMPDIVSATGQLWYFGRGWPKERKTQGSYGSR
jgi:hypothetical protein